MNTTCRRLLAFVVSLCVVPTAVWADLGNSVPDNSCCVLHLKDTRLISRLSEMSGLDVQALDELNRLLFLVDHKDGTSLEKSSGTSPTVLQHFANMSEVSVVIESCKKGVGDFSIIVDFGNQEAPVLNREDLDPIVQIACDTGRRFLGGSSKLGHEFEQKIDLFESGYRLHWDANRLILSSSDEFERDVISSLEDESVQDRAYLAAQKAFQDEAMATFFFCPSRAEYLSPLWERYSVHDVDTVGWTSWSLSLSANQLKTETVVKRLLPAPRTTQYWDFVKPIERFPTFDPDLDWARISVKSVNMPAWRSKYRSDREKSGNVVEMDAISAFQNGFSRTSFANETAVFEFADSSYFTCYDYNADNTEGVRNEVTSYFNSMNDGYLKANYKTQFAIKPSGDEWRLEILNPSDALQPFSVYESFDLKQTQKNSKAWASKYATLFDGWCFEGNSDAIDQYLGSANSIGIDDYIESAFEGSSVGRRNHHYLQLTSGDRVGDTWKIQVSSLLFRYFGVTWKISDAAYEAIVKEPTNEERRKLTNPQAAGFLARTLLGRLTEKFVGYVRLDRVEQDKYYIEEILLLK